MINYLKGFGKVGIYVISWTLINKIFLLLLEAKIPIAAINIMTSLIVVPLLVWILSPAPIKEISIREEIQFLNKNPWYCIWGLILFIMAPISALILKMMLGTTAPVTFSPYASYITYFGLGAYPYVILLSPLIYQTLFLYTFYQTMVDDAELPGKIFSALFIAFIAAVTTSIDLAIMPGVFFSQLLQIFIYEKSEQRISVSVLAGIVESILLCFFWKI